MARWMVVGAMLLIGAAVTGCGGTSEEGEECDTPGATTEECDDGLVCSKLYDSDPPDAPPVCIKICTDHPECRPDESCNGIEGTNLKGCRKKE